MEKIESTKSASEMVMEEILKDAETIIDDSYIKTKDAREILNAGYKLLIKCEELRKSRDVHRFRRNKIEQELKRLKAKIIEDKKSLTNNKFKTLTK